MRIQLEDFGNTLEFAPLTLTRPIGDLRCGLFTNTERWEYFDEEIEIGYKTLPYLQSHFPAHLDPDLRVNACLIPSEALMATIVALEENTQLQYDATILAIKGDGSSVFKWKGDTPLILRKRWDLFTQNDKAIALDFEWFTKGRQSAVLSESNRLIGDAKNLFIEEGASIEGAILNVKEGPIYIGSDSEIMEGSLVRGAFALMDHAVLKMGAKVYGATTIGPYCKVGGEVGNSIFYAYSNKGHEGYVGNSLIGEWCNLGADTNTSNLKNNYGKVDTYSYVEEAIIDTDQQFMGVSMGDHSKCGINTMFNTATVIGVSCNVYGGDFLPKYIPSFSWGTASQLVPFRLDKAIEYANNMMQRRKLELGDTEVEILNFLKAE